MSQKETSRTLRQSLIYNIFSFGGERCQPLLLFVLQGFLFCFVLFFRQARHCGTFVSGHASVMLQYNNFTLSVILFGGHNSYW